MRKLDLVGQKFGRLTFIERVGYKAGSSDWRVRCDCGTERIVKWGNVRTGQTMSCGCKSREDLGNFNRTHGMSGTPEYRIWKGLLARCLNPSHKNFAHYGGRGIRVCDRWQNEFSAFFEDLGVRPTPKHSLDRINNDGNYEPGNCRWATSKGQASNRRDTRMLTLNGETMCAADWSRRLGIGGTTILSRVNRGWSDADALTRPTDMYHQEALYVPKRKPLPPHRSPTESPFSDRRG